MTGIVKTDQLQGAQGTTVTVPTGNTLAVTSNATVGGTLGVTGTATLSGNATIGSNSGDTRFHLNSANQYTMKFSNAGNVAGHLGGGGSDVLRFSNAAGATIMEMNAGQITKPLQPAFGAHGSGTSTLPINVYTKIPVTVERFDQNGDFDTSTKVFTAPVAGRYQFSTGIYLYNYLDNEAGYLYFAIVTSNETYDFPTQSSIFGSDIGTFTMQGSALADLDAGDTAYAHIYQQAGTAQATISHGHTFFTGFLAC